MYFCDIENRESKEIVPGVRVRTFWQTEMVLCAVDLEPGAIVPTHSHMHEQCGTVMSGRIKFVIGDETKWLEPGDAYIIPGNLEHMAEAGDTPVRLFEVFSPVREDFKY